MTAFECRRCGNCCRWHGYVRLSDREIDAIAAFLNLPVREFIERYTRLTADRSGLSLLEKPDGCCIFLDEPPGCRIEPVKPRQCRDFPLRWNFENWQSECRGVIK